LIEEELGQEEFLEVEMVRGHRRSKRAEGGFKQRVASSWSIR
jgi:hypothetical protein